MPALKSLLWHFGHCLLFGAFAAWIDGGQRSRLCPSLLAFCAFALVLCQALAPHTPTAVPPPPPDHAVPPGRVDGAHRLRHDGEDRSPLPAQAHRRGWGGGGEGLSPRLFGFRNGFGFRGGCEGTAALFRPKPVVAGRARAAAGARGAWGAFRALVSVSFGARPSRRPRAALVAAGSLITPGRAAAVEGALGSRRNSKHPH